MDVHSYCVHCQKDASHITPMTQIDAQGQRRLRYLCQQCNLQSEHLPVRLLKLYPVPQAVLQVNGFDPQERVLTRELSREDFDYWLGKLPARKASGADLIT
jgi:protein-arginine kinase activator protein McsA